MHIVCADHKVSTNSFANALPPHDNKWEIHDLLFNLTGHYATTIIISSASTVTTASRISIATTTLSDKCRFTRTSRSSVDHHESIHDKPSKCTKMCLLKVEYLDLLKFVSEMYHSLYIISLKMKKLQVILFVSAFSSDNSNWHAGVNFFICHFKLEV